MAIVGYIRVSTDKQNYDGQKLSILNYANDHLKGRVDAWIEVKASTRKSAEKRKLGELRETLKKGDTLIVAELSRLGRSVGQIAILVDGLVNGGIEVITIKEGMILNGKRDMKS